MTIKEVLMVYFGFSPLEIVFKEKGLLVVKDETVHGLNWDERSPFSDALYNICKMISIYVRFNKDKPEEFYLNENKSSIGNFRFEEIEKLFNKKNYTKL